MLFHVRRAVLHAIAGNDPLGKVQKGHLENALSAVARQNLSVDLGTGKGPVGRIGRKPFRDRFLFDAGQELSEISAALLCRC